MNIIWARALFTLVIVAVVGVLAAVWLGLAAGSGIAGLLLLVQNLLNTYHAQRLWRLLDAPVYGEVPSALGLWGEIYYRLYRLAKRWHAQVRDVQEQHARFIEAIQASPNGVMMLDSQNHIEWSNEISGQYFGIDITRDLGQHVTHLVRQPEFVRYLDRQCYDEALIMHRMGETR